MFDYFLSLYSTPAVEMLIMIFFLRYNSNRVLIIRNCKPNNSVFYSIRENLMILKGIYQYVLR